MVVPSSLTFSAACIRRVQEPRRHRIAGIIERQRAAADRTRCFVQTLRAYTVVQRQSGTRRFDLAFVRPIPKRQERSSYRWSNSSPRIRGHRRIEGAEILLREQGHSPKLPWMSRGVEADATPLQFGGRQCPVRFNPCFGPRPAFGAQPNGSPHENVLVYLSTAPSSIQRARARSRRPSSQEGTGKKAGSLRITSPWCQSRQTTQICSGIAPGRSRAACPSAKDPTEGLYFPSRPLVAATVIIAPSLSRWRASRDYNTAPGIRPETENRHGLLGISRNPPERMVWHPGRQTFKQSSSVCNAKRATACCMSGHSRGQGHSLASKMKRGQLPATTQNQLPAVLDHT